MRILFFTDLVRHLGFDPIGVMSLSSTLKEAGHETRLVPKPRNLDSVLSLMRDFKPDVLAFSVTTGIHRYYLDLNLQLKAKHDVFSIFGGAHPTFFPEMVESEGVDAICIGEGEKTLLELVDTLASKGCVDKIPGICVKDSAGKMLRNPVRDLVADLDSLPVPDRELAYSVNDPSSHGIISMFAARGCPYQCTYCFNHAYKNLYGSLKVRFRSVPHVIAEALELKRLYSPKLIVFCDDILILKKIWFREFVEAWASEVQIPFSCNGRFDLLNDEVVQLLKKAGCTTVVASVESGNERLRNEILKRNMSEEQIQKGAECVRKHKLGLLVQGILALPLGSLATDLETLDVIARARPSNATVTLFQPYPRTELGELAMSEGLCSVGPDDIPETYRDSSILNLPEKKQQERLAAIFGLAVEFPIIRRMLPLLLHLPIKHPGAFLTRCWNGYCAKFRLYPSLKYSLSQTILNSLKYIMSFGG